MARQRILAGIALFLIMVGLVLVFLAHPSCLVVEDPGFEVVKLLCDLVKDAGDRAALTGLGAFADRARAS